MRNPQDEGNKLFCGNCGELPPRYYCRDCGFLLCQNCVYYEVPAQPNNTQTTIPLQYDNTPKETGQLVRQCKACKSKNVFSIQEELDSLPNRAFSAILPIIQIYERYDAIIRDYSIQCYEIYAYRKARIIAFPEIEIHLENTYKYFKQVHNKMKNHLIKFRREVRQILTQEQHAFHNIAIENITNAEDAIKVIQQKVRTIEENLRKIENDMKKQKENTKPIFEYLAEQHKLVKQVMPYITNETLGSEGILGVTENISIHVKKTKYSKKGKARILFMDFEMVLFFKKDHEVIPIPWTFLTKTELKYNKINGMQLIINFGESEIIIKEPYPTLKTIYDIIQKIQKHPIKQPDKEISQNLGNRINELLLTKMAEQITSAFHTKIFIETAARTRPTEGIPSDPRELMRIKRDIFAIKKTLEDIEGKLEKGTISPEAYAKSYRMLRAQLYPLVERYKFLGGIIDMELEPD